MEEMEGMKWGGVKKDEEVKLTGDETKYQDTSKMFVKIGTLGKQHVLYGVEFLVFFCLKTKKDV